MKIGWIGFGKKGIELVNSLIYFGHEIYGYNRTYKKMSLAIENGLIPVDNIETLVEQTEVIFTLLSDANAVYEVYCKDDGILPSCAKLNKKITCIDLTTSSVNLAKFIANNDLGVEVLDAPFIYEHNVQEDSVFYTYPVGGKRHVFEKYKNLFNCLGSNVYYVGEAGCGQVVKKANEMAVLGACVGMMEAITYGYLKHLDLKKLFNNISNGAGTSKILKECYDKVIQGEYELEFPANFALSEVETILKENRNSLLVLTKVIYGLLKKTNKKSSILSLMEFYKESFENE